MQPGLSNQTRLFTVAPKTFLMNDRFSSVQFSLYIHSKPEQVKTLLLQ